MWFEQVQRASEQIENLNGHLRHVLMRNVYIIYSVSLDLVGVCTSRLGGQSSSSSRRWRSRSTATRFPSATSRAAWPSTPAARRRASASQATTSAWRVCSCRCWGRVSGRCHRACCRRPSWSHMWVADGIQGHIQDFHLGGGGVQKMGSRALPWKLKGSTM